MPNGTKGRTATRDGVPDDGPQDGGDEADALGAATGTGGGRDLESIVRSFAAALGGDVETIRDLPFTEDPDADGVPERLYVRHDETLLDRLTDWLNDGQHVGLCCGPGSGKTALRGVVERELQASDGFGVASVTSQETVTPRRLSEAVLQAGVDLGYRVKPDGYGAVTEGIPWRTDEVDRAVGEVVPAVREDGRRIVLVVDGLEAMDATVVERLRRLADTGVQLFLLGRPEARTQVADLVEAVDGYFRLAEGIAPFDAHAVAEYVARSMADLRGEAYDGSPIGLFSGDAIEYVVDATDGNPRAVQLVCLDLFVRAAAVWEQLDVDVDRVTITASLADRDLALLENEPAGD
jgi:type II secretory pathway predicted ATPase ExeA